MRTFTSSEVREAAGVYGAGEIARSCFDRMNPSGMAYIVAPALK